MPLYQEELILRSLELGNLSVNQIMVPRTQIVSLPDNMLLRDAVVSVVEEQRSRVPSTMPRAGQRTSWEFSTARTYRDGRG